ncbi:MAG: SCO family protein, partial [Candidatus Eremiobacterota bacterium]
AVAAAAQDSLRTGDVVPDFTLTDQNQKSVSFKSFRGKVVLITFLYTRCPYPDKCPMIAARLSALRELADRVENGRDRFHIVAVSIDPKKDTPEVLKRYAANFHGAGAGMTFLTGKPNDIARVAGGFGVLYWDNDKGVIDHNLRTALVDPQGRIHCFLPGADWKPGEVAKTIQELLKK